VSVCSLMYPACGAHEPHCHLWPVLLYSIFPHSHKRHDFWKEKLTVKLFFIFSTSFVGPFLILRRTERGMIKKYLGLYVNCPLFLSEFNENLIFSTDFRKIIQYQISWKSVQWEPSCSMWVDGQKNRLRRS